MPMRFVAFEDLWMNVSVSEPDSSYAEGVRVSVRRQKVRFAVWRCLHGHRHSEES